MDSAHTAPSRIEKCDGAVFLLGFSHGHSVQEVRSVTLPGTNQ